MARAASLALLAIVLLNYATSVAGHGWMVSPTPRSGGGTGSGNASTASPCGGAGTGSTSPTATWTIGATVSVSYMRANAHGVTGQTVNFKMSRPASLNVPAATDFTNTARYVQVVTGATMDVTLNTPQTTSFTVPNTGAFANFTAPETVLVQFQWTPTTGGNWFDCAYISLQPAGGVTSCTGAVCPGNSTCIPGQGGAFECRCNGGFAKNTDVTPNTCEELPPAIPILMRIEGATVSQDTFTRQIAAQLTIPASRILYDQAVYFRSLDVNEVAFAITADDNGVSGQVKADELVAKIRASEISEDFPYKIVSVQVNNEPAVAYGAGPAPTPTTGSTSSKTSGGKLAGIVIGAIVGAAVLVAIIVVVVVVVLKRRGGSSSGKSSYPTNASGYPTNNAAAEKPISPYNNAAADW